MSAPVQKRGFDTLRAAGLMRRALLPVAVLLALLLWRSYGTLRVPDGMDTTPAVPPGSLCVIEKSPGDLRPGQLVFAELGGGLVLSRIRAVDADGVLLENDSRSSRLPDSRQLGPVPRSAIRALVLSTFAGAADGGPAPPAGEPRRGR
ncbi:MAG: hypothetical protein IPM29_12955 [Planctomycetes bacterium]|nr:hypothetical protein [Planctomycetota bacterium]